MGHRLAHARSRKEHVTRQFQMAITVWRMRITEQGHSVNGEDGEVWNQGSMMAVGGI